MLDDFVVRGAELHRIELPLIDGLGDSLEFAAQAAAFVITAVLVLAAIAKLRDRTHVVDAMRSLRLPVRAAHPSLAFVVPIVEIVLAVGLLMLGGWPRVIVSLLTTALMVAYFVVIVRALTFREPITCACFGELGAGDVSRATAVRNALLVVLGVVAAMGAFEHSLASSLVAGTAPLAAVVALAMVVAFLAADRGGRTRTAAGSADASDQGDQHASSAFPAVRLQLATGRVITAPTLLGSRPGVFFHLSWTCEPCMRLLQALPRWASFVPEVGVYCVVPLHDPDHPPRLATPLIPVFDTHAEFAARMPPSTPAAVLIGTDGMMAADIAVGTDEIRVLLDSISNELGGEPLGELIDADCRYCG